jgi:hypothetical protein
MRGTDREPEGQTSNFAPVPASPPDCSPLSAPAKLTDPAAPQNQPSPTNDQVRGNQLSAPDLNILFKAILGARDES